MVQKGAFDMGILIQTYLNREYNEVLLLYYISNANGDN